MVCYVKTKTYSYVIEECNENKKAKNYKKVCEKKKKPISGDYKNCQEANKIESKINQ